MKNKSFYIGSLLLMLLVFAGCHDDDYTHPSEAGIPLVTDLDVNISVDQSINQVTFSISNKACMPVWIFDGKTYSTVNGLKRIYARAGEYSVDIKVANANGISDGIITKTFKVDNTIVDFSAYIKRMAGDDSKQWMMAKGEAGHLGCGEPGSDGLGWWSASANEKAAWGIYDDVVTFGADKSYIYNPGEGGTVYVNTGCSVFNSFNTNDGNDFMATVSEQTTTYDFDIVGDDVYITLPAQTLFPYIPNDENYNQPRFKIASITTTKLELVSDNGAIAWHYTLSSGNDTKPAGYDPDHACNLWKNATYNMEFWYAPGWAQIADPGFEANGNAYKITLPEATTDTWQAQVKFLTDMSTNAANNYDFSAKFMATENHSNITVKLVQTGDDNVFYFVETVKVKAYEEFTLIKTDMPGLDMENVSLVLDFGGNAAGTVVTVSRVVLKEHSCDDGTIIEPGGGEGGDDEDVTWLPDADSNLWKNATYSNFFYYAPGWNQVADPTLEANGNSYKISLPEATFGQWQAQVHFLTDISTSADKNYDFRCIFNSTKDMNGVTVKLTKVDEDATFYFTEQINLTAYEDYTFKMVNMEGIDIDKINLVFDFGGNPENCEVTVSSIVLQEHGAGKVSWNADSSCNLWNGMQHSMTFWYAPGWAQIADPVMAENGNSYTFILPQATTDQWQAQVHFHTDMTTNEANSYDFHCQFEATKDMNGTTIKLTKEGDDNTFYFTERINIAAYEVYTFEMTGMPGLDIDKVNLVFDFGGNPDNCEVTVSKVILKESSCNN